MKRGLQHIHPGGRGSIGFGLALLLAVGGSARMSLAQSTIPIASVTGLQNALNGKVSAGPGFADSSAAVINSSGSLDAAMGAPNDCLHVDGSSGSCGSGADLYVDDETPAGTIDGSNGSFSLSNAPAPAASLLLFRNGIRVRNGVDYNLSGNTITFMTGCVPAPGDMLSASYRVAATKGLRGRGVPARDVTSVHFVPEHFIAQVTDEQAHLDIAPVPPIDSPRSMDHREAYSVSAPPEYIRSLRMLQQRQNTEAGGQQDDAEQDGKQAGAHRQELSVKWNRLANILTHGRGRKDSVDYAVPTNQPEKQAAEAEAQPDSPSTTPQSDQFRSLRLLSARAKATH